MKELLLPINGTEIYVKIIGEGKPLVFLHGGPGGEHRFFLPHIEALQEHYQLILYDQRGCGLSGQLENEEDYTIHHEVETLHQLRMHFGIEKLNLIGESWGSMLALCYATAYPEHVDKILLTAAVGATAKGFEVFGKELESRLTEDDRTSLDEVINKLQAGEATVQEIFTIINPYYVYSTEALTRKTKTNSNEQVNRIIGAEITSSYDLRDALHKIEHVPITVLQGDHDMITPSMLNELLLQYIPHATLVVLEKCGHWSVVEQPDRFNKEVAQFFQ